MRQDMYKVIVERPRAGGDSTYNKRNRHKEDLRNSIATEVDHYFNPPEQKYEDIFYCCAECTGEPWLLPLGSHEREAPSGIVKMRPVGRGVGRKMLNENLSPLWHYLRSQVGKCWDDVYSDIRKNLSPKSTVQMHVVQHLKWQVEEKTFLGEDGLVYAHKSYRGVECMETPTWSKFPFYVHPVTRELCESPSLARKIKKKPPVTKVQAGLMSQYRLIDGLWYVVELEEIPKKFGEATGSHPWDKVTGILKYHSPLNFSRVGDILFPDGLSNYRREQEYVYSNLRAVSKRPIGKRERKQLKALLKSTSKRKETSSNETW